MPNLWEGEMMGTIKEFIKENATITEYAFNNLSKKGLSEEGYKCKRNYWKGYKTGWIACINNLLMEAPDNAEVLIKNRKKLK